MQTKMNLHFDYWPILRADAVQNQLVQSGDLQDTLSVMFNNCLLWPEIELSKEGIALGTVKRSSEIEIMLEEMNTLKLINRQTWIPTKESLDVTATVCFVAVKENTWKINFTYDFTDIPKTNLETFNNKFGIGCEKFHFKVNGEALLVNQLITAGKIYQTSYEFPWEANTPILMEIEEFGHGVQSKLKRFIQGVRFTIK